MRGPRSKREHGAGRAAAQGTACGTYARNRTGTCDRAEQEGDRGAQPGQRTAPAGRRASARARAGGSPRFRRRAACAFAFGISKAPDAILSRPGERFRRSHVNDVTRSTTPSANGIQHAAGGYGPPRAVVIRLRAAALLPVAAATAARLAAVPRPAAGTAAPCRAARLRRRLRRPSPGGGLRSAADRASVLRAASRLPAVR